MKPVLHNKFLLNWFHLGGGYEIYPKVRTSVNDSPVLPSSYDGFIYLVKDAWYIEAVGTVYHLQYVELYVISTVSRATELPPSFAEFLIPFTDIQKFVFVGAIRGFAEDQRSNEIKE